MRTIIPAQPGTWELWIDAEAEHDHEEDPPYWVEPVVAWLAAEVNERWDPDNPVDWTLTPLGAGDNGPTQRDSPFKRVRVVLGATEEEALTMARDRWSRYREYAARRAVRS